MQMQRLGQFGVFDFLGKLWNLPNTVLGLFLGFAGYGLSWCGNRFGAYAHPPGISVGNNAIQFHNNVLMVFGALTVGNVICYGCRCAPHSHGAHERQHTIQGQVLGPFYLPLHLLAQLASVCTHPIGACRGPSIVHGKANFLEVGPLSDPPRPWPITFANE